MGSKLSMRIWGGASFLLYQISLPVKKYYKKMLYQVQKEASPHMHMEASYMVECAVALPFFTGFMAALLFFFQVLYVQQEIGNALLQTGRELSVIACQEEYDSRAMALLGKAMLLKHLDRDSASSSFLLGGRLGIILTRSDFSGNYIDLRADYRIRLPFSLFGEKGISVTQRLKCRKWTGGDYEKDSGESVVYITPSGSVYHRKRDCAYLNPSVEAVNGDALSSLRNAGGGKYYPCLMCMKGKMKHNMVVYLTQYGDRYHCKRDCGKIRRTVYCIRLSEAQDRSACSKCGRE